MDSSTPLGILKSKLAFNLCPKNDLSISNNKLNKDTLYVSDVDTAFAGFAETSQEAELD